MNACNCPNFLPKLTKEETDKYEIIFKGKITDIQDENNKFSAKFKILEPLKGLIPDGIVISYDGLTSCAMPFDVNDTWLIYANKDSITHSYWTVNFCDRSRKFLNESDTIDMYTVYSGITMKEEYEFIRSNYPTGQVLSADSINMIEQKDLTVIDARRDLNHASPTMKFVLIGVSIVVLVAIYLLLKKLK